MSITILSEHNKFLHVLNSQARDKTVYGNLLANTHKKIGRVLCEYYLSQSPLMTYEITTVQDKRSQTSTINMSNIAIVVLLRAGLYLAEGARETLEEEVHNYILSNHVDDLIEQKQYLQNKRILLVDSVINSGKSIEGYIEKLNQVGVSEIACLSIVMQKKFYERAVIKYPDICFITSRVSENYFVGKGQTDTGNRLFGVL